MTTLHPSIVVFSAILLSVSVILYAKTLHNPTAYYILPTSLWVAFIYFASWSEWFGLNDPMILRPFARMAFVFVLIVLSVFFLQAVFMENTARRKIK